MNFIIIIFFRWLQFVGISPKTYDGIFNRLKEVKEVKAKGHILKRPTLSQINRLRIQTLRKLRIYNWKIEDVTSFFKGSDGDKWRQRPLNVIDKIIIGSNDAGQWNANKVKDFDMSENNNTVRGMPLPGIGCHLFINKNSVIEMVSPYCNIISHTASMNIRSIFIMLQYTMTNVTAEPSKGVNQSLHKTLVLLCMQLKLNPYKAIRGQREVLFRFLPFIKKRGLYNVSPGKLIMLDNIRSRVAIKMQKLLRYAGLYKGEIDGKFNRATKKALNRFDSNSILRIYSDASDVKRMEDIKRIKGEY